MCATCSRRTESSSACSDRTCITFFFSGGRWGLLRPVVIQSPRAQCCADRPGMVGTTCSRRLRRIHRIHGDHRDEWSGVHHELFEPGSQRDIAPSRCCCCCCAVTSSFGAAGPGRARLCLAAVGHGSRACHRLRGRGLLTKTTKLQPPKGGSLLWRMMALHAVGSGVVPWCR